VSTGYDELMQSPIALSTQAATPHTSHASTSYHHMSTVVLTDGETTVRAVPQPGGIVDVDRTQYVLKEIHCHTPSEHTVNGHQADLEAHFVHTSAEGAIAVLAVMFDADDGRHPVDAFIAPPGSPPTTEQLDKIVPKGSKALRYVGSLTTKPYTDEVEWVVFTEKLPVGRQALDAFAARYGPNNRELQQVTQHQVTYG